MAERFNTSPWDVRENATVGDVLKLEAMEKNESVAGKWEAYKADQEKKLRDKYR